MHQSVEGHIANCGRCIRRKDWNPQHAPLVNTVTSQPMELVCRDFLNLEPSKGGTESVIVVTDQFSPNMSRHMLHVTKQQRQMLVYCMRTFSFIMDFLKDCIAIRVGILRARRLRSFEIWPTSRRAGLHLTILWVMVWRRVQFHAA